MTADIRASNGVVHLIDRFLLPLQSNLTIAQYLKAPDIPGYSFASIEKASIIDTGLRLATNSTDQRFTVFAPNDSFINVMPDYGQDVLFNDTALLKSVFWAHILEGETVFLSRLGELPARPAKAGVIKFHRDGADVYVTNNRVRARVIRANLPVSNGVIHVIDNLLFFVYRNMLQTLQTLDNIVFMAGNIGVLEKELSERLGDPVRKMTLFLPTDDAFAKLPQDKQLQMDGNGTHISRLYRDHMVMYGERDVDSFQDGETFSTADGQILTIRRIHKGGGVRAKITIGDIGCTNGVVHLVNSVLFQRDFTIWDAVQGNSQLREMRDFISLSAELMRTLGDTGSGPLTALLVSDAAVHRLPQDTRLYLQHNANILLEAVHGSIAHGVILSSTQIPQEQEVTTLSGRTITLYNTEHGVYAVGSRIRANVVIEDIWCSNGVLHVTDNLLHVPTRNILNEIQAQPGLSVMGGVLQAYPTIMTALENTDRMWTMFVPGDEAFTDMPTHRALALSDRPWYLAQLLNNTLIPGANSYLEEYGDYTRFTSAIGSPLFVVKEQDRVYANVNNVRGTVTRANIRCTNGLIHVVDTFLGFPFYTVAEVFERTHELKPFYDLISGIDDFYTWSDAPNTNLTLLVPSAAFMASLSDFHRTFIESEPGMDRKIFNCHAIPSVSLSQLYLNQVFHTSRVFLTENRYNITFTLIDVHSSDHKATTSVDIGFTNLRHTFDLVSDGIGCSNGVIYVIDGFLNFPLHDTLYEIKNQPDISLGVDQLLKLVPGSSSVDLSSRNTMFTVFAPTDGSLAPPHLSRKDIEYLNTNLTDDERSAIVQRHIVRGQQIDYDSIIDGSYNKYARDRNISIISRTDGFYLKWEDVEAKIVRPNILATNGIIHVVDRFMLATPIHETTLAPRTTTQRQHVSGARTVHHVTVIVTSYSVTVTGLVLMKLFKCFYIVR
ncbi:BGH3-like protein [Mya arenaria]|uniref:BGH3-like protein n=1 Tax=Mya arenaria TaxID=6604 RepID=A0ABY7EBU2_MYAAR|nr:BGH3-like protein [Mya arenaria]